MSLPRLITLLVIVAGLVTLVLSNLSPSLALVFLGLRSPALGLGFWILIAIAIGVLISLAIVGLFQLSNSWVQPQPNSSSRRSPKPPVQPFNSEPEPLEEPERPRWTAAKTANPVEEVYRPSEARSSTPRVDDWETEVRPINPSWEEEDWDNDTEEFANPSPSQGRWKNQEPENLSSSQSSEEEWDDQDWEESESPSSTSESSQPMPEYEVPQTPKTESWSGSVYSFGYRDDGNSGVGQTESVYDADYRVITPPAPETQIQTDEEEDWVEEEGEDSQKRKPRDDGQSQ